MPKWWEDDQALAYAIVEQGRVACEHLLHDTADTVDARYIASAHRGFGVAGYAISDDLAGAVRAALYVVIHEAGPVRLPGAPGTGQALLFATHASAAIERCFDLPHVVAEM